MNHGRWILPVLFAAVSAATPTLPQPGAAAISAVLKAATDRGDVPGVAVAVVNKDGLLYNEAFGKSRTLTDKPMAKDTIFNMASMTKPVWGLGFQLAADRQANRRSPGSGTWAGIFNTHFFIDPSREIGVVVMMQTLPFYDEASMKVYSDVEEAVYRSLKSN
jgi:CubicO group peptidase (beta-lactamase class C family)